MVWFFGCCKSCCNRLLKGFKGFLLLHICLHIKVKVKVYIVVCALTVLQDIFVSHISRQKPLSSSEKEQQQPIRTRRGRVANKETLRADEIPEPHGEIVKIWRDAIWNIFLFPHILSHSVAQHEIKIVPKCVTVLQGCKEFPVPNKNLCGL